MVCLYHLDDDGKCAASIVAQFGHRDEYDPKFFEMNYGYAVPFDQIQKGEYVYIVDFSIEPTEMLALFDITSNVIWIDHHASSIKKYENFPLDIYGFRSTKHSGAMLTFMYLTNRPDLLKASPEELIESDDVPIIINLIDDYDMWRFLIPETKIFHMGLSIIPHDPLDPIWTNCTEEDFNRILASGETILKYRADMMKTLIDSYGYETTFEGYSCFVLNQGIISSEDFASIDKTKYDILVGWIYSDGAWHYQLRSLENGPDVSEIATKYGGGGHVHAAGFRSETKWI